MNKYQKTRLKKAVVITLAIFGLGIAYYFFVRLTGFAVPCVIHKLTGIYCAGCGITRMFVALFQLDLISAARNNLLALFTIIPVLIFAVNRGVKYVRRGSTKFSKGEKICTTLLIVLMVIFTLLRNLPYFHFLQPI